MQMKFSFSTLLLHLPVWLYALSLSIYLSLYIDSLCSRFVLYTTFYLVSVKARKESFRYNFCCCCLLLLILRSFLPLIPLCELHECIWKWFVISYIQKQTTQTLEMNTKPNVGTTRKTYATYTLIYKCTTTTGWKTGSLNFCGSKEMEEKLL